MIIIPKKNTTIQHYLNAIKTYCKYSPHLQGCRVGCSSTNTFAPLTEFKMNKQTTAQNTSLLLTIILSTVIITITIVP